nr:hypothetical protein GCM10023233_12050 [Brevibacterium otitidis]
MRLRPAREAISNHKGSAEVIAAFLHSVESLSRRLRACTCSRVRTAWADVMTNKG